jgi:hypothetical protein
MNRRVTKNKSTSKKKNNDNISKNVKRPNKRSNTDSLLLTSEEKKYLRLHKTLKLQIELVPKSCWFSNTRSNLKGSHWDRIRKHHYAKANNRCEICGGKGKKHPFECHEVWLYNEKTFTQKLGYFQAICPLCHEVKHIGLAGILGNGLRAFNRFKRINKLDKKTANNIIDAVFKQWRIRSQYKWNLDIEYLKKYGIDTKELNSKSKHKIYFRI